MLVLWKKSAVVAVVVVVVVVVVVAAVVVMAYFIRNTLMYLLTPEKLTGPQLVRKFPTFRGTRRFITAFTRACHLSLS